VPSFAPLLIFTPPRSSLQCSPSQRKALVLLCQNSQQPAATVLYCTDAYVAASHCANPFATGTHPKRSGQPHLPLEYSTVQHCTVLSRVVLCCLYLAPGAWLPAVMGASCHGRQLARPPAIAADSCLYSIGSLPFPHAPQFVGTLVPPCRSVSPSPTSVFGPRTAPLPLDLPSQSHPLLTHLLPPLPLSPSALHLGLVPELS